MKLGVSININLFLQTHGAFARSACSRCGIGDALAGLMEFCGWTVTREYYINDAGGQVDVLARSTIYAIARHLVVILAHPAGLYPGIYLRDVGEELVARGERFLDQPETEWMFCARICD